MHTQHTDALRPDPDRGSLAAAAAVALALTVSFINSRFDGEWGEGIHLLYTALAAAVALGMAAMSPRPGGGGADRAGHGGADRAGHGARPAAWQSVLFIVAFVLVFGTLSILADILGAEGIPDSSGTVVWVGLLLVGLAMWFARGWNSGISTLLGAITLAFVIVAFVDWVFSPEELDTFRWILLLIALGFGAMGVMRRDREPDHAVGWVNAAGLALLGLALSFVVAAVLGAIGSLSADLAGSDEIGTGWELVVLVGGAALIAYSVITHRAGPGYLGAANLVAFGTLASTPDSDGPSLIGWPIVLLLLTLGLLAAALRRDGTPGAGAPARPAPDPADAPTTAQPGP